MADINNQNTQINNENHHNIEDIELTDNNVNNIGNQVDQDNDNEHSDNHVNNYSITDRLLSSEFRENAMRRIDNIGRRFNILDRVFRHPSGDDTEGSGARFDGVFSNLTPKPDNNNNNNEDELRNDRPPTYDEAAADLVPSYYGLDLADAELYDELCIDELPVGNMANLIWNIIVSASFQYIGFLITYMLHTSHAAKQGSRFGLGITFLGYGYSMIPNNVVSKVGKNKILNRIEPSDPNNYNDLTLNSDSMKQDTFESNLSHGIEEEKQKLPMLAVMISILGLFITLKSIVDFIKIKRKERKYLAQETRV